MTQYTIELIIKIAAGLVLTVVFGNGCVVMFNRMPMRWFEDYAEDGSDRKVLPDRLLASTEEGKQRIPSTPWKYIFVALFGVATIYLAITESLQYEVGTLFVLAIVIEMATSDQLYQVVPDQLAILLAISSLGFINFYDEWWELVAGAGIGLALSLAMYGLGRLIYKRPVIGGADIKFYACIGLVTGRAGVVAIFLLTSLFTAIQAMYHKLVIKDNKKELPMMPAAAAATAVYMLLLSSRLYVIGL